MNMLKLIVFMTFIAWLISCSESDQSSRMLAKTEDDLCKLEGRYKIVTHLLYDDKFLNMMYRGDASIYTKEKAKGLEKEYRQLLALHDRLRDSIGIVQRIRDSLFIESIR